RFEVNGFGEVGYRAFEIFFSLSGKAAIVVSIGMVASLFDSFGVVGYRGFDIIFHRFANAARIVGIGIVRLIFDGFGVIRNRAVVIAGSLFLQAGLQRAFLATNAIG